MSEPTGIIPAMRIETVIIVIRDQRVIVDADLARLYGVSTKRLNEQVKRNLDRFPPDFMFQLTASEKAEVVANCDHLVNLKSSPQRPYAFTEHGAIMAANVLNSTQAVQASVLVVRAFVRLRQFLAIHREFAARFDELEDDADLRSQLGTPSNHGDRRYPPYAFTEQGLAMLSDVLRSPRAVAANI